MTTQPESFQTLLQQTATFTPSEKLQLIAHLANSLHQTQPESTPRLTWSEIRGAAPYPLFGEDAQTAIARSRQEAAELSIQSEKLN